MIESPLSEVIRDRQINEILNSIREAVRFGRTLTIEPKQIDYIRRHFHEGLRIGERKLYEFAQAILGDWLSGRPIEIKLMVLGRCPQGRHDTILENQMDFSQDREKLFSVLDSSLAAQYSPMCHLCGAKATVIASYLRYGAAEADDSILRYLFTRIKTTSNLCYKIADLVFEIDHMFQRDKVLNVYSHTLSDLYGIKVVVGEPQHIPQFVRYLREIPNTVVIEENDYTGPKKKKSGFEAYKVVVKYDKFLLEIQLQTQSMFDFEQSSQTANHKTYKERLMEDRRKLGAEYIQLFQALSQLFQTPEQNYCDIAYIELGQIYAIF